MEFEVKDKQYYLDLIEGIYNEVKTQIKNEGEDETDFDFGVELDNRIDYTEEIIVGYYLLYYDDEALEMWEYNTSFKTDLVFNTDEGVHYILKKLFEN